MKIKLEVEIYEYLLNNIFPMNKKFETITIVEEREKFVTIELQKDVSDLIKDFSGELLQIKGFDARYNLNSEGELLEKIEDLFHC